MRESPALAPKPADTAFEEAASVCEGAILALGCLRPADLRKGKGSSPSSHRGGQLPGGHRPVLPAGASGRRDEVRRERAEDREGRPDRQRRPRGPERAIDVARNIATPVKGRAHAGAG